MDFKKERYFYECLVSEIVKLILIPEKQGVSYPFVCYGIN